MEGGGVVQFCHIALTGLTLGILLFQLPNCWGYHTCIHPVLLKMFIVLLYTYAMLHMEGSEENFMELLFPSGKLSCQAVREVSLLSVPFHWPPSSYYYYYF